MEREARNHKFWQSCRGFILKDIVLCDRDIVLIGYFPYHTARIRQRLHRIYTIVPRTFLKGFEDVLALHNILDNKAVYIMESNCTSGTVYKWALMLKDDWAMIGGWEDVTDYDSKPLKLISK